MLVGTYIQGRLSEEEADTVLIVFIGMILNMIISELSLEISRKFFEGFPNF
jgi:hypothetical protein